MWAWCMSLLKNICKWPVSPGRHTFFWVKMKGKLFLFNFHLLHIPEFNYIVHHHRWIRPVSETSLTKPGTHTVCKWSENRNKVIFAEYNFIQKKRDWRICVGFFPFFNFSVTVEPCKFHESNYFLVWLLLQWHRRILVYSVPYKICTPPSSRRHNVFCENEKNSGVTNSEGNCLLCKSLQCSRQN